MYEPDEVYAVMGDKLNALKAIERDLYGDGCTPLNGDRRRDMANYLNQVFFPAVEGPVDENNLATCRVLITHKGD